MVLGERRGDPIRVISDDEDEVTSGEVIAVAAIAFNPWKRCRLLVREGGAGSNYHGICPHPSTSTRICVPFRPLPPHACPRPMCIVLILTIHTSDVYMGRCLSPL